AGRSRSRWWRWRRGSTRWPRWYRSRSPGRRTLRGSAGERCARTRCPGVTELGSFAFERLVFERLVFERLVFEHFVFEHFVDVDRFHLQGLGAELGAELIEIGKQLGTRLPARAGVVPRSQRWC